ncbi:MAG: tRNA (adenosine(37)-N6)-threonylcarbamoyltransferase complex dimerization subunit type 1 TsaB [Defluviitaleaceae bacterium]|nr:tRNA (adenosine(37)-N6)-threonylcarbamoyltransferase complex dimerization subunit type 1 TsaB [Defluviitaleaceae bacterium]
MKILGIDASGLAASAAVTDGNTLLGEITTNCKRNHSETLMPMIAELFERLDMRVDDIGFIACTNGPGSFTGLRIGAATAMSLAHGAGKKVIPVPTLDALAYNLYGCAGIAVPMMDARRGQVYTAFYDGGTRRLTDYMAISPEEALARLAAFNRPVIFLGDGAAAHSDKLKNIAPAHLSLQRASAVAALGLERADDAVAYDKFELFYLRKPQAEREYLERTASP